jgi:hemoglobin
MKHLRLISSLIGLGLLLASASTAAGNIQEGSAKAMFCAGCHGLDGNVSYPSARLAGQSTQGLRANLSAFKQGQRLHPVMNILSLGLTQKDLDDLTLFYAAQKPAALEHASLYWRLGGDVALNSAVDETIKLSQADPRLTGRITGACAPKLKEQLCAAAGGPCSYTGRDMKTAHTGLNVTAAEFVAVADNLVKVLDTFRVPAKEKSELIALVAPLRSQMVGH